MQEDLRNHWFYIAKLYKAGSFADDMILILKRQADHASKTWTHTKNWKTQKTPRLKLWAYASTDRLLWMRALV